MMTSSFNFKKIIWYTLVIFSFFQTLQAANKKKPSIKSATTAVVAANKTAKTTTTSKPASSDSPKSLSTSSTEEPKTEADCLKESTTFEASIKNHPHLKDAHIKTLHDDYLTKKAAGLAATRKYFAEKNKKPTTASSTKSTSSPTSSSSTLKTSASTTKASSGSKPTPLPNANPTKITTSPKKLSKNKTSMFE